MAFIKVLHVLFLFTWIGSLLFNTRFVAHLCNETFEIQKRMSLIAYRTYFFIELPSMCIAIFLGIILLLKTPIELKAAWFHMKLTFAFFLIVCDIVGGAWIYKMHQRQIFNSALKYKILHSLAGIFLILTLVSIYVVRNKEREIIARYNLRENRQTENNSL